MSVSMELELLKANLAKERDRAASLSEALQEEGERRQAAEEQSRAAEARARLVANTAKTAAAMAIAEWGRCRATGSDPAAGARPGPCATGCRREARVHKTKIDWCDYTWNPVWGCLNHCPYCYARATAKRWGISFEPHWRERNFNRAMPKQPARIFVNSMSDIACWLPEWWYKVLGRIDNNPQHTFLFLTKQPEIYYNLQLPSNCWLGVTLTGPGDWDQYVDALKSRGNLVFWSYEPMLEKMEPGVVEALADWVILAAESGNRPGRVIPPPDWIQPWVELKGIPVFMKHNLPWSGTWRKEFPA